MPSATGKIPVIFPTLGAFRNTVAKLFIGFFLYNNIHNYEVDPQDSVMQKKTKKKQPEV